MRLFVLSLSEEENKWFRYLPGRSIATFEAFQTSFLEIWNDKTSPLQVISKYNKLNKGGFESIHEFSSQFMRVYNSILIDIKPLVGFAKIYYVDSFDGEFALLLREIKSTSIPVMFQNALEVEANMMASGKIKQKVETDKRKSREENVPSASALVSSNDVKFEMILEMMENMIDRISADNRPLNRE